MTAPSTAERTTQARTAAATMHRRSVEQRRAQMMRPVAPAPAPIGRAVSRRNPRPVSTGHPTPPAGMSYAQLRVWWDRLTAAADPANSAAPLDIRNDPARLAQVEKVRRFRRRWAHVRYVQRWAENRPRMVEQRIRPTDPDKLAPIYDGSHAARPMTHDDKQPLAPLDIGGLGLALIGPALDASRMVDPAPYSTPNRPRTTEVRWVEPADRYERSAARLGRPVQLPEHTAELPSAEPSSNAGAVTYSPADVPDHARPARPGRAKKGSGTQSRNSRRAHKWTGPAWKAAQPGGFPAPAPLSTGPDGKVRSELADIMARWAPPLDAHTPACAVVTVEHTAAGHARKRPTSTPDDEVMPQQPAAPPQPKTSRPTLAQRLAQWEALTDA